MLGVLTSIALFTTPLTAEPTDAPPPPDTAAAITLYREKRNAEARAAFEQLAAADPKNAEAAHYLGQLALREKRDDDATRHHERAAALAPANVAYLIALGDAYGRQATRASLFAKLDWAEKCRTAFERAFTLDPASEPAQAALIEYYRRAPSIAGGGLPKAYAQAEAFRKINLLAGTQLLVGLYHREAKFSELFAAADEALRVTPDDYLLLYALGRAAAASGQQLPRGTAALQRCLALTPPPRAPSHASAWVQLGKIHERQNAPAAARTAYETALTLEPDHREAAASLK